MATAVVRETVSRTHRQIRVSLTGNGSDGRMIFIYQGPVNAVEAGAFNSIVRQIQSPGGWSTSRLTRSGWRFPQSSR